MLLGTFEHEIDAKHRIAIPAKFRWDLGEKFVITKGKDSSLKVFSMKEWERFEEKHRAEIDDQDALQDLFDGAQDVEVGANGRIVLPAMLEQYAGIKKALVTRGLQYYVEIWAKEVFEEHERQRAERKKQA